MDKQTLELAKQYTNPEYFGATPLDQIALWELRDVMSYHFDLQLGDTEKALVDKIVGNLLSKTAFSWKPTDLTIVGEAKVQGLLRDKGQDLKCFDLNEFPTSIDELTQKIEKQSLKESVRVKFNKFLQMSEQKYRNFKFWLTVTPYFHFGILVFASLAYALYTAPVLGLWAILAAWVFCNCSAMLIHEWWTHDLIIPRNRVISFIFDYVGHILFMTSRLHWRWDHRWHHKYWKTEKDVDYVFKNTPAWFYLFFATPIGVVMGQAPAPRPEGYLEGLPECRETNMVKLTPESRFLENHWISVTIVSHAILIAVMGYVNWTYFVLLQAWLFRCYIIGFNEITTHWPLKLTREEETNTPYLFPLCCGTAYHVDHHFNATQIVLGPGKLKYLNIQYWFIRLFFKPAPGAKYS